MISNYLRVAMRNLWKNKGFSAINIIGLAAGLAVFLLIILFVTDEWRYDRHYKMADRIYRLEADIYFNNTQANFATSPDPMAPALLAECPQVEQMTRVNNQSDVLVKKGNENIPDHNLAFTDSTFFRVFSVTMVEGNPETALSDPASLVVDETTARKYFNTLNVIGQTMTLDNNTLCKITGVIRDLPRQSHFHFHFFRPRTSNTDWLSNNAYSYIVLRPGVQKAQAQAQINKVIDKHMAIQLQAQINSSLDELKQKGNHFIYHLRPLTDIHLHANNQYEIEVNGDASYVYIFSVIAILILLIACVNFMNLSTARSANRAREVGIRKVAGSPRGHLIFQFLVESALVSFLSLLLAFVLAALALPLFNQLSGKEMTMLTLFSGFFFPVLVGLVIVVGLIAGSYPAFYLSSFQPIQVLKGNLSRGFKRSALRSGLVVFQFAISITLIIGTFVIYRQLQFINNKKLGYDRNQVLLVHNIYNLQDNRTLFKEQIKNLPGVLNVTAGDAPTGGNFDNNGWFKNANLDASSAILLTNFYVDENYIPTLGMEMKEGRNFSKDMATDSSAVILNESALKVLGLKDPFSAVLYRPDFHGEGPVQSKPFRIVGIVKDFNFTSLRKSVEPLIMMRSENYQNIAIRVSPRDAAAVISACNEKWKTMAPGQPFNYSFMDDDFARIYTAEQRTGKIFFTFALFAIFIGCLGLFGLVSYAAEQRAKEIGVRKVLGATTGSIVSLLSRDFARLVLIASVIAFPAAWWIMNRWLQDFAYRITIQWWVFVMAGVIALLIALITVGIQAVKAAVANPVKSLRTE